MIFLVLAFYRLFKGVDRNLAVLVVILGGVMPVLIDFLNTVNDGGALMAVRGADFLSVFDKPQRDALAMLFLRLHHQAIVGAEILWGLWLLPLGMLVYRSRFFDLGKPEPAPATNIERPYAEEGLFLGTSAFTANGWAGSFNPGMG